MQRCFSNDSRSAYFGGRDAGGRPGIYTVIEDRQSEVWVLDLVAP
jgi:hypothetical protein